MFVLRTLSASDLGYKTLARILPGAISPDRLDAQQKAVALAFELKLPTCPANVDAIISADNTGRGTYFDKAWRLGAETVKSRCATNDGGSASVQVGLEFVRVDTEFPA